MKKSILTALVILFAAFSFAQNTTSISEIEKAAAEIKSNLVTFNKIEKYNESTASKYLFLKDGQLKLAQITQHEAETDISFEWYFKDGQFIFSKQITTSKSADSAASTEELYANNGKLIKWVRNGVEVDPASVEFKMLVSRLMNFAQTLLDEAKQ